MSLTIWPVKYIVQDIQTSGIPLASLKRSGRFLQYCKNPHLNLVIMNAILWYNKGKEVFV